MLVIRASALPVLQLMGALSNTSGSTKDTEWPASELLRVCQPEAGLADNETVAAAQRECGERKRLRPLSRLKQKPGSQSRSIRRGRVRATWCACEKTGERGKVKRGDPRFWDLSKVVVPRKLQVRTQGTLRARSIRHLRHPMPMQHTSGSHPV